MWESEGLGSPDVLWASTAFTGGIAGQQAAPCGALSSAAVCLGLRHRCDPSERERAKRGRELARRQAYRLVSAFRQRFGDITCIGLLGLDFSTPEGREQFRNSGVPQEKCYNYLRFILRQLYEMGEEEG